MRWTPVYHAGVPWPFRSREHQYTTIRRAAATLGIAIPETPGPISSTIPAIAAAPVSGASYAVVHPGGSWSQRRWHSNVVKEVCETLLECGITSVHLIGGIDEIDVACEAGTLQGVVNHMGKQSVGEMVRLIAGAAFFVGNDSAPAHIAAGFGIPGVVTCGPQDPALFGALGGTLVMVGCTEVWCSPCWQTKCVHKFPVCLDALRDGSLQLRLYLSLSRVKDLRE